MLSVEKKDLDADAISSGILAVTEQALDDFDAMREREGAKLRDDVLTRLETIDALVSTVERESPRTVAAYRERLEAKMAEVLGSVGIETDRHWFRKSGFRRTDHLHRQSRVRTY